MLLVYRENRKQTRNNDNSHKNLALVSTKKIFDSCKFRNNSTYCNHKKMCSISDE